MKIYNWVVTSILTGEILEEDSFEYQGDIEQCKGGGGGSESKPLPLEPWMKEGPYAWLKDYFGEIQQEYDPMGQLQGYIGGQEDIQSQLQKELTGVGGAMEQQRGILENLQSPEMMRASMAPYLTQAYQGIGQAGIPSSSYADKLISNAVTQGWLGNVNQTLGGLQNLSGQTKNLADALSTAQSNVYNMTTQPVNWMSDIQKYRYGSNVTTSGSSGKGGFLGI